MRGRHHLQVVYNGAPVLGTPVEMFVTISPTKLGKPIKSIDIGDKPKFVAINSSEEILVTTKKGVIAFDKNGRQSYTPLD